MSKRIDCDRCMRVYREFRPAAVKISGENYCLNCMRTEGYEVEDGELIVQPTPSSTPMGVPKVLSATSVAEVKALDAGKTTAPVAEKKESDMSIGTTKLPKKRLPCSTPKCSGTHRDGSKYPFCGDCMYHGLHKLKTAPTGPHSAARTASPAETKKRVRQPVQTPAARKTITVDATQHDGDMATISVPAAFIQKYWDSLTLTEQAQLINQHIVESRA